jgi:hypothetical protein
MNQKHKIIVAIDTETTGLLAPNASPIERQPYIIEVCAEIINKLEKYWVEPNEI